MAPPKAGPANDKDAIFMMTVLKHIKGQLKVDWDAFAVEMNLKSRGVATTRFGQIKTKLGWTNGEAKIGAAKPAPKVKKAIAKRQASNTGRARVKRARRASDYQGDSNEDEIYCGDTETDVDTSDEKKDKAEGELATNSLGALIKEMEAEDQAGLDADEASLATGDEE